MGQGGVGKTAMVLRYTTGDFNEQVRTLRSHPPCGPPQKQKSSSSTPIVFLGCLLSLFSAVHAHHR